MGPSGPTYFMKHCQLCGREGSNEHFERHHLIPKNKKSDWITVCHQCGDQIHLLFSNSELKHSFNTLLKIRQHHKMQQYIRWVKDKPLNRHFSAAKKKRRK